jgi:hypothetical protein
VYNLSFQKEEVTTFAKPGGKKNIKKMKKKLNPSTKYFLSKP